MDDNVIWTGIQMLNSLIFSLMVFIYAVVWFRSNVPISKMSSFKMNPDFGCVLF